jgi:hypothetical protein
VYIIPDMNEQAGTLVVNGATMTNLAQGLAGQTWNFEGSWNISTCRCRLPIATP